MNKIDIHMPPGIRYMSEARDYLLSQLPFSGKYILNKSLTGCGGTELFLTSGRTMGLFSPRSGMLYNKCAQHPEAHLFRDSKDAELKVLKQNLKTYLASCSSIPGFGNQVPIILSTIDSAKYIFEELEYQGIIDNFLFVVDEFQNLIGDSAFKGKTDLEFLKLLNTYVKNICYMSATPIHDKYLDLLPEFQGLDYYQLVWDPSVIVEHSVKEVQLKKDETAADIFQGIIKKFRKEGYFEKKIVDNQERRATESVAFINDVRTIEKIIEENNLTPGETTILISESAKAVQKLKKKGFSIGVMNTDRNNPSNKTFTFCSKAAFEGCDFYSNCAFTYIFLDGTKDWQTHDTAIEIPQILGRQRLDANPFKYNATIYYRTNPKVESKQEFESRMRSKLQSSDSLINTYNTGDPTLQKAMADMVTNKDPKNPYSSNYLDVIHDPSGYRLEINYLVAAAEHNLWENKAYFYNNPLHLTTAIQTLFTTTGTKPKELRDFENKFYALSAVNDKMRLYATFRTSYPHYRGDLYQNPFIDFEYHQAYDVLGPIELARMNHDMNQIAQYFLTQEIINLCQERFVTGKDYRANEVKSILQDIYNKAGVSRVAKANQLAEYMRVSEHNKTQPDGSRQKVYVIL